jgi:hypothetical protein
MQRGRSPGAKPGGTGSGMFGPEIYIDGNDVNFMYGLAFQNFILVKPTQIVAHCIGLQSMKYDQSQIIVHELGHAVDGAKGPNGTVSWSNSLENMHLATANKLPRPEICH